MTRYPGRFAGIGERALAPLLLSALPVPSTLGSPITEATGIVSSPFFISKQYTVLPALLALLSLFTSIVADRTCVYASMKLDI